MARIFANEEPLLLRITKKNGGVWDYQYRNEYNADFRAIVKEISKRTEEQTKPPLAPLFPSNSHKSFQFAGK